MDTAQNKIVTIDGKDHAVENLSEAAKAQLTNLHVVDKEIARLKQNLAIAQTARKSYANALKAELPSGNQ